MEKRYGEPVGRQSIQLVDEAKLPEEKHYERI
jgi:hypothetical protein